MISEDTVLEFAASSFNSVWTVELLLMLKRDPNRSWEAGELIRELRSSQVVVAGALANLLGAGLVVEQEKGRFQYQTSPGRMEQLVDALEIVYDTKPTAVVRAIVATSNRKLKLLSDAFRFKE
ncbi:MAG: hypothetical protein Q8M26_01215 [Pseudolabrys sp.]|nr:hypothetical protein [Pseudolabrys sp.]